MARKRILSSRRSRTNNSGPTLRRCRRISAAVGGPWLLFRPFDQSYDQRNSKLLCVRNKIRFPIARVCAVRKLRRVASLEFLRTERSCVLLNVSHAVADPCIYERSRIASTHPRTRRANQRFARRLEDPSISGSAVVVVLAHRCIARPGIQYSGQTSIPSWTHGIARLPPSQTSSVSPFGSIITN